MVFSFCWSFLFVFWKYSCSTIPIQRNRCTTDPILRQNVHFNLETSDRYPAVDSPRQVKLGETCVRCLTNAPQFRSVLITTKMCSRERECVPLWTTRGTCFRTRSQCIVLRGLCEGSTRPSDREQAFSIREQRLFPPAGPCDVGAAPRIVQFPFSRSLSFTETSYIYLRRRSNDEKDTMMRSPSWRRRARR